MHRYTLSITYKKLHMYINLFSHANFVKIYLEIGILLLIMHVRYR